ncbi:hypothetical protein L6R49_11275 [Myxococcota bacterium]|nr:hypothetical protein [Myxococcota bacterium]
MTCTLLFTLLIGGTAWAQDGGSPWGGDEKKDKDPSGPWGTQTPPPQPAPAPPPPAEGWDAEPTPETPAWETPPPPPPGGAPTWGTGEPPPPAQPPVAQPPVAQPPQPPTAQPPMAQPPPPPPPRLGPARDCLSDLCARGDRLSPGKLQLDGLMVVADPFFGVSQFTGSAELAWVSPAPVAGVAAVWTVPVGSLQLPIAPTLLVGANQTWRDYGGNVIRTHGGALALNVGGLVSGGVGFGHHNTLPINFYDQDDDGSPEQGELRLGTQRVSPYLYVGITPVTFARLVGRQLVQR